ncbi:RNA polymerase sigma factor [Hyphococcus sp. DH-69]|uniref:RNA polymerase sigma factor n=1 Tax=Hyphococcus formosus TaxID=3143534 RepID=UPI00398A9046
MSPILKAYLEHQEALKRFLSKFLSRADDIEDIAQDAFLRSFAAEARQEIESPKSFIFTVAKNLALSEIAKKSNSTTDYLEDFSVPSVLHDERQVGAEEELESRQKLTLFSEAVAQLPTQCRRVFIMRKLYGMKNKDIAAQLSISISAVEKHVALGLLKCSDYLVERGYGPADFGRTSLVRSKKQNIRSVTKIKEKRQ